MSALQERLAQITSGGTLEEPLVRLYNNVFGTEEGKLVLEDLKLRAYHYVHESKEAQTDRDFFIATGARKLLLHILEMSAPLTEQEVKPKEQSDGG